MKSNGKRAHEICILHRSSGLRLNSSLTQNTDFMHTLSPLKFMFLFKKSTSRCCAFPPEGKKHFCLEVCSNVRSSFFLKFN